MKLILAYVAMVLAVFSGVGGVAAGQNAGSADAPAKPFILDELGAGEQPLDQGWVHHVGDDARFAASALSTGEGWQPVKVGDLGEQGVPYSAVSWYRLAMTIRRSDAKEKLALRLNVLDAYEVFWDGEKILTHGKVPAEINWPARGQQAVALPLAEAPAVTGVLAIRVWCQPPSTLFTACGFWRVTPTIGDVATQQARQKLERTNLYTRWAPELMFSTLMLVVAIAALVVFLRNRHEWIYLWFAIYMGGCFLASFEFPWTVYFVPITWQTVLTTLDQGMINGAILPLSLWLVGVSLRSRLQRVAYVVAIVELANNAFDAGLSIFWAHAGDGMRRLDAASTVVLNIAQLLLLPMLAAGLIERRRSQKGSANRTTANWPAVVTALLYNLFNQVDYVAQQWPNLIHWTKPDWLNDPLRFLDFEVFPTDLMLYLFLSVLGVTMARKFLHDRVEEQRAARELQSAREVQSVLVPEQVPTIPGFAIASIYRPASEVSGDFFQVFPLQDGAFLLAIGDVSGKGLKAAMTVSLLVGALHALTNETVTPAELMTALNVRLAGRMGGGFVTCLLLRVDADGDAEIANAGHIPPYVEGVPLEIEGSLPLGMMASYGYEQVRVTLAEGTSLTLLTDGVLEAQNARGEVYGFERLAALLAAKPTAEAIVDAACTFGQEDDITVLTLTRLMKTEPAGSATVNLTVQVA